MHRANVRIIAATNRRLPSEVKGGRFRADLYHRLSMYPLQVPPLRERAEDIPILAGHFMEQSRIRLGLARLSMSPATIRELAGYAWPGNVRELEHVVLRAALRASAAQGEHVMIEPFHLDGLVAVPPVPTMATPVLQPVSLGAAMDDFQRQLIDSVLVQARGNWAEAARTLQVDRSNLHRLAKRLKIKTKYKIITYR